VLPFDFGIAVLQKMQYPQIEKFDIIDMTRLPSALQEGGLVD
jgi:hypothetical protein